MLLKLGADPRVYVDDGSTPEQVHKGRQNPRGTLTPPLPKLSGAWWLSWLGPDLPGPSSPSPYGSPRFELSWERAIKTTAPDFRGPLARVLFSLDPQSTLEVLFPRKVGKQQGSWGQRGGQGLRAAFGLPIWTLTLAAPPWHLETAPGPFPRPSAGNQGRLDFSPAQEAWSDRWPRTSGNSCANRSQPVPPPSLSESELSLKPCPAPPLVLLQGCPLSFPLLFSAL